MEKLSVVTDFHFTSVGWHTRNQEFNKNYW